MEASSASDSLPMLCPECGKAVDVSGLAPYAKIECPHCTALIRVRTTMGHYEIVGVLGEGGMSRVFRALDRNLGREVALKVLHQSLSRDEALTAMFEREAKLTASIVHPNVVKVFSVGQDHGYFYIAMELLQAISLEQLIANKGALPEPDVLGIALDVARGLKAAFDEQLIHRDIKPGNLLVTGDGTTKLVDFGLALQQGGEDLSDDLWATPFYVPPEKLDGAEDTFRGDIYSLGATLYHALAGKPPFEANTSSLEQLKEIKRNPVELKAVAPGLSKATVRLVERMMAYSPEDRVASYGELVSLVEELRRRQFGIETSTRARGRRGKARPLAALFGGGIVVVVIALFYANRPEPVDPGDLGIGNGERVITVGDSTVANQFREARDLFAEGSLREASDRFRSLSTDLSVPASTRIWSHFLLGTIQLIEGETEPAADSYLAVQQLSPEPDAGSAEVFAFLQRAATVLAEPLPVLSDEAAFSPDSVEALGLLAAGLKNWQEGAFESGAALLGAFLGSSPPEGYPWIEPLKGRVEPFLADWKILKALPNPSVSQGEGGLRAQADSLKEALEKLRTRGAAPRLVKRRLGRIDAIVELAAAEKAAAAAVPAEPSVAPVAAVSTPPASVTPATAPTSTPEENADLSRLKKLLEESRPLAEAFRFSDIAARLQEEKPATALGESLKEELVRACGEAGRYPADLAVALSDRPWEGSVRRRAGRTLEATVSADQSGAFVVDLGFGPNEVEAGEFAPDWLVEAGLDTIAVAEGGGGGLWNSLAAFALLSGCSELIEEPAAALAGSDGEFARRWSLLSRLR